MVVRESLRYEYRAAKRSIIRGDSFINLAETIVKEKITVKVGDRVMYDKYAGTQIKMDGEDYLIVKNSDIIAVIE